MRNGALITGRNTWSSSPVDIRGRQLVEPSTCRFCEGDGFKTLPRAQVLAVAVCNSVGHPTGVPITVSYCTCAICTCDGRRIGSMPVSTNGAIATGPTMVMRYSRLVTTLKSPPGNVI